MKIALITDVHANLPALEAALSAIAAEDPDLIIHTGDAIAIGPYPAECVDLLTSIPNLRSVLGNHELYYLNGLPRPRPAWMSAGEMQHQIWTHQQLGPGRKEIIGRWPLIQQEEIAGIRITCQHYGLIPEQAVFQGIVRNPSPADLDRVFQGASGKLVFFGHDHAPCDQTGRSRYLNPGSLGCCPEALARYIIAEFGDSTTLIHHRSVPYEDAELQQAFVARDVPEREFISSVFYGGRFSY